MRWGEPLMLLLAVVPVLLLGLYIWAGARRRMLLARLGDLPLVQRMSAGVNLLARRAKAAVLLLALLLLVPAIARFQYGQQAEPLRREGVDVVVVLDTSDSMLAEDIQPSRLAKAKLEVARLIQNHLQGDRVGIVAFSGAAHTICPLTLDYGAALLFLEAVDTDTISLDGTNLYAALEQSLRVFDPDGYQQRVVLLITDGEDHEGEIDKVIEDALADDVVIYTIGVGSTSGQPIPVTTSGGQVRYKKDRRGNVVTTKLDARTLQEIALQTGGAFYHATAREFDLATIYAELDSMRKAEFEEQIAVTYKERFQWFLVPALLLLTLELFIGDRRRKAQVRSTAEDRDAA